jgi:hypothetical protein
MTESDKIRGIIESAVESAFIDFPHIGHEETWPQKYKESAEPAGRAWQAKASA